MWLLFMVGFKSNHICQGDPRAWMLVSAAYDNLLHIPFKWTYIIWRRKISIYLHERKSLHICLCIYTSLCIIVKFICINSICNCLSFAQVKLDIPGFILSSGVGVTKAPFVNFSVSKIFDLAKAHVRFFESHSYLTGVTAAELRRHLPNINVIFNS